MYVRTIPETVTVTTNQNINVLNFCIQLITLTVLQVVNLLPYFVIDAYLRAINLFGFQQKSPVINTCTCIYNIYK